MIYTQEEWLAFYSLLWYQRTRTFLDIVIIVALVALPTSPFPSSSLPTYSRHFAILGQNSLPSEILQLPSHLFQSLPVLMKTPALFNSLSSGTQYSLARSPHFHSRLQGLFENCN